MTENLSDFESSHDPRGYDRTPPVFTDVLLSSPGESDGVRAAETAAQRSVCDIPDGPLPDDLALALERRIEVTRERLADDPTGWPRGGGSDPEVRELEAPYRRVQTDDAPTDGGHQTVDQHQDTQSRKD